MAHKRLSMRKIKEIITLRFAKGLTHRQIAASLSVGASSVGDLLGRFNELGFEWQEALMFSEDELETALYPRSVGTGSRGSIPMPDWTYVHKELRRKSMTLQLLWEEYREANPAGYHYTQFCHHYRNYRKSIDLVFRNEHIGGEKLFVDYAGMTIPILDPGGGELRKAQIFVATFGASNFTYAEATWTQQIPDWIASHQRCFAFFGGAPQILVPDNLKSAVQKPCRWDPDVNPTYHDMASHYGCAVIPARVRKPKDKAKVENAVLVVERWILSALRHRQFFSLSEVNEAIKGLVDRLNNRPFKKIPGTRSSHFSELDKPRLKRLPLKQFELAEYKLCKVNINYHVEVEKHNYSVPYNIVHKKVEARFTGTTIEILYKGQRVASHARSYKIHGYTTLSDHMPPSHASYVAWTPERLSRWALQTGKNTQLVAEAIMSSKLHPQQGFRSVMGLTRLGKMYGGERLEAACERALNLGATTYKTVNSILKSKLEYAGEAAQPIAQLPSHSNIRGKQYYASQQF
jgi:transposase